MQAPVAYQRLDRIAVPGVGAHHDPGDDGVGGGIDGEVNRPPSATLVDPALLALPRPLAADLQARAVDHDDDRVLGLTHVVQDPQLGRSLRPCLDKGQVDGAASASRLVNRPSDR
nr:hypothetical protein [Pirellulimonas nuda]